MRALEPAPLPKARLAADAPPAASSNTSDEASVDPVTIPISKESLLYFLRSRHCASCNAELFPASDLTERRNAGAPPEVIEEARRALPTPETSPAILPTLNAVASEPCPKTSNPEPGTSNLANPLPLSAVLLDNRRGCAWPDRTSSAEQFRIGSRGQKPCVAACQVGRLTATHTTSCLPAEVAGQVRNKENQQCAKSLPCNVRLAKTGTTQPRRTRRPRLAVLNSRSSAIPAASTRTTKRRSKSSPWPLARAKS
jgi:hypothetical protein